MKIEEMIFCRIEQYFRPHSREDISLLPDKALDQQVALNITVNSVPSTSSSAVCVYLSAHLEVDSFFISPAVLRLNLKFHPALGSAHLDQSTEPQCLFSF